MQKSPWAWQAPPLSPAYSVVSKDLAISHDRIWHRKLWGLEASFGICCYALPGMADIIISCHLTPPSESASLIDEDLVKAAVRALRFDYPTIATKFAWPTLEPGAFPRPDDGRFVYEVPASEEDIDTWLSEVVVTRTEAAQSSDVSAAVAAVSYDLGRTSSEPSTTLFELHFIPSLSNHDDHTCAVVFRLGHALFDGIGSFQFVDMFNAKLALLLGDPERKRQVFAWGEEVARLTGAVPERAQVAWEPEKAQQDDVMLNKLRGALSIPKTVPGLDVPHPLGPASTTGVFMRTLSPPVLSRLIESSRANGCTIFSVLLSAMILALLRLHPPHDTSDINIAIYPSAVDLRPKNLRQGEDQRGVASTVGFHVYVARDLGKFIHASDENKGKDDLWELAREIKGQVNEQRGYMDRIGFWGHELMEILGHFAAAARARDKRPEDRIANLSPLPNLSSLGVVDPHFAPSHLISEHTGDKTLLAISNPRFSSRIPYNPSVLVHPYTWQGTLYIPMSFPEGYMGSAQAQEKHLAHVGGEKAMEVEEAENEVESAPVLQFVNEFMTILEGTAGGMETRTQKVKVKRHSRSKSLLSLSGVNRIGVSEMLVRLRKACSQLRRRDARPTL